MFCIFSFGIFPYLTLKIANMKYYLKVLKNYAVFSGRASRSEYWYFVLFNFIVNIVLGLIERESQVPYLRYIYFVAVLIPSLAVAFRRMHDINKSGWFAFIPLYNLILACTPGTPGDNRYGPDPYGSPAFDFDQDQPAVPQS
jgi:uncharacterized membrane protein YhaH (DUF805 family)